MQHRCVKCAQSHTPGQCTIPAKEFNTEVFAAVLPDGTHIQTVGKPLTCANCKGPHPASDKNCPFRVKAEAKRKPKQVAPARKPASVQEFIPTNFRTEMSYAAMAGSRPALQAAPKSAPKPTISASQPLPKPAPQQANIQNASNTEFDINSECQNMFGGKDLTTCLKMFNTFKPSYMAASSTEEKQKLLFNLFTSLCL